MVDIVKCCMSQVRRHANEHGMAEGHTMRVSTLYLRVSTLAPIDLQYPASVQGSHGAVMAKNGHVHWCNNYK